MARTPTDEDVASLRRWIACYDAASKEFRQETDPTMMRVHGARISMAEGMLDERLEGVLGKHVVDAATLHGVPAVALADIVVEYAATPGIIRMTMAAWDGAGEPQG